MSVQKVLGFILVMSMVLTLFAVLPAFPGMAYSNGSYYEKPAYTATHLYAIDASDMTTAERTMIATLQGIIANKTSSQIYITDTTTSSYDEDAYTRYLDALETDHGITHQHVTDPWTLIDTFKVHLKGYILYQSGNSSINAASSLAGLQDAIAVETSLESTVQSHGLSQVMDVRSRDEAWVIDHYWSQLNQGLVIEAKEEATHAMHLRDYAVMSKALVFYDGNSSFRSAIMDRLDDDSVVMGWGDTSGGSEEAFILDSSQRGVHTIPADWALNLSVLSGIGAGTYSQNMADPVPEENVHYVCFYVSDGDNLQWTINRANDGDWWGSAGRGTFPLGWTMPPGLVDLAPSVQDWYYSTATQNDNFIAGPSGNGFIFPGSYPASELSLHTQRLNDYMGKNDMRIVAVIGRNSFDNTAVWDQYTAQPNIDGLFYYSWAPYFGSPHNGRIVWSNHKPVISTRYKLADGLSYAPRKNTVINGINSAPADPRSTDGYSLVCVDSWNNYDLPATVKYIVDRLDSNVRVVTPEAFVKLIKQNLSSQVVPPAGYTNVALNKTATANQHVSGEDPYKAVDAAVQNNSKWCSNVSGDKWLKVDLGQQYNISRWIVRHAGAGGETTEWNTRDFKLQASSDGSNWTDIDVVTGNTSSVTDRMVTPFTTRYARLYVTDPTQTRDAAARIYEFELYVKD